MAWGKVDITNSTCGCVKIKVFILGLTADLTLPVLYIFCLP